MMKDGNKINLNDSSLGIELGSTRIKGVLIDTRGVVLAAGDFEWKNQYINNNWTYDLNDVWLGVQDVYSQIKEEVLLKYHQSLETIGSIGISAMMHGYLPFNNKDELLVPFRTWRNASTEDAEKQLTEMFQHNIPQRWSVAHLYQAILDNEKHISEIDYITTLAGYVHWQLTGKKVLGIGDASGMFPIDEETKSYDTEMITLINEDIKNKNINLNILDVLPKPLYAGQDAGVLSEDGAMLLDPSGELKSGILVAPPEGDAGTGMVATNAIKEGTGNVSAGTSVFAMIVLEEKLKQVYPEIDLVTTPLGAPVAMVHVNNCTSEINAWVNIFKEFCDVLSIEIDQSELYRILFNTVLEADQDQQGLLAYGYHSGENITKVSQGYPLFLRESEANFTLANFMKSHLDSAFATLAIGMNILFDEDIEINSIVGHGGIFKTEGVAQKIVAQAVQSPVTLMETASEGGAWGMALLAQYRRLEEEMRLTEYLETIVFKDAKTIEYVPTTIEIETYKKYIERYKNGLSLERKANVAFED